MNTPIRFAKRLGQNTLHAARLGLAEAILPREPFWLHVKLKPPLDDLRTFSLTGGRSSALTFLDLLQTLTAVAGDRRVAGVLVQLKGAPRGWGKVTAVRRAVAALVEGGTPVVAYGEVLGAEDLLIASAASQVWMPEAGGVSLVGLRAESLFLRGVLERLKIQPDVVRVGSHKSAAEFLTREEMSPENREQMEALLDDLYEELVQGIAQGRQLEASQVKELIDRGPYTSLTAKDAGLIDACLYPDEVEEKLADVVPATALEKDGKRSVRSVDAVNYHVLRVADRHWRPVFSELPRVGYLVASGLIHSGTGARGVASETFRRLIDRLREDDRVRGVLLRIDSGGGEPLASDLIWRALHLTAQEKPVVVSMGDAAASGGYYLATAAHSIFAEPGTVTGSIGVIGGKLNLEGLYAQLGVVRDGVERGARAGIYSERRSFTPDERAAVRKDMGEFYDRFVDRVAESRGLTREAVEKVAQGRVWSGVRARVHGLVDELGGPLEALAEVLRRAGLAAGDDFVVDTLPRMSGISSLRAMAGGAILGIGR